MLRLLLQQGCNMEKWGTGIAYMQQVYDIMGISLLVGFGPLASGPLAQQNAAKMLHICCAAQ
jgi:hypothetical protein